MNSRFHERRVEYPSQSFHQTIRRLFGVREEDQGVVLRKHDGREHILALHHDAASVAVAIRTALAHEAGSVAFAVTEREEDLFRRQAEQFGLVLTRTRYFEMRLERLRAPGQRTEVELRPLTGADEPSLRRLARCADEACPFHDGFAFASFLERRAFGAFEGPELVGVVGVYLESDTDIEIGYGYVRREYRGAGLLRALCFEQCAQLVRSCPKKDICGIMMTSNHASRRSVEAIGFELAGEFSILELTKAGLR